MATGAMFLALAAWSAEAIAQRASCGAEDLKAWTVPASTLDARAPIIDCTAAQVKAWKKLTDDDHIHLSCNLKLNAGDAINAHLFLQGSKSTGVSVDCAGGSLNEVTIRSAHDECYSGAPWDPVTDVSIRNCRVLGALQVTGMGATGHHPEFVLDSSQLAGPVHVERVRAAAPSRITLDNLVMVGDGWTPLFLGPGVSYLSLSNSEVTGVSAPGPAIYLDSESHHNTIQNNLIHTDTERRRWQRLWSPQFREQIAVDNASSNTIINNSFAQLLGGGVYVYRNCGEKGAVRHTTPQYNHIVNNFFYYSNTFTKDSPAIFIGSRDGTQRSYCNEDAGHFYGSSVDDRSFARYNVVAQNQIRALTVSKMIKMGDFTNRPNYIDHNETVQSHLYRQAGCYRSDGVPSFVPHGATMSPAGGPVPIWSCSNHKLGLVAPLIVSVL